MGQVAFQFSLDSSKSSIWPPSWVNVPETLTSCCGERPFSMQNLCNPLSLFSGLSMAHLVIQMSAQKSPPRRSHSWQLLTKYTVPTPGPALAKPAAFFYGVYLDHKYRVQLVDWPIAGLPLLDYELLENLDLERLSVPLWIPRTAMDMTFHNYLLKERILPFAPTQMKPEGMILS